MQLGQKNSILFQFLFFFFGECVRRHLAIHTVETRTQNFKREIGYDKFVWRTDDQNRRREKMNILKNDFESSNEVEAEEEEAEEKSAHSASKASPSIMVAHLA